jgi:hypothetical protein
VISVLKTVLTFVNRTGRCATIYEINAIGKILEIGVDGQPKPQFLAETDFFKVTTSPVFCQTSHRSNFFRFFQVAQPRPRTNGESLMAEERQAAKRGPVSIQDQVEQQLTERLQAIDRARTAALPASRPYEVSSWLEMTQ